MSEARTLPRAEAFAVQHGRFTAVGTNADVRALAGASTRIVDAAGMTVTPGFIDTHSHSDVRVLAATNQRLADLVRAKRFREDLYFRLNVVTLELPPLRDRGDDILLLAEHFLQQFSRRAGRRIPKFTAAARKRLISHTWPGNVRELRNLMERLAYLSAGEKIDAEDLAFILSPSAAAPSLVDSGLSLNDATHQFQQKYIEQSIARARGNVSQAAHNLGVHRSNLYRKMRQLGMETSESDELPNDE